MSADRKSNVIENWPDQSRVGPWKRVSARCHDEQANFLALNLMHDIATGKLRFDPVDAHAADRDQRVLTDEELERAQREGRGRV